MKFLLCYSFNNSCMQRAAFGVFFLIPRCMTFLLILTTSDCSHSQGLVHLLHVSLGGGKLPEGKRRERENERGCVAHLVGVRDEILRRGRQRGGLISGEVADMTARPNMHERHSKLSGQACNTSHTTSNIVNMICKLD